MSVAANLHTSIPFSVTDQERSFIRRELLAYLSNFPRRIFEHPGEQLPDLTIQIGNLLIWLSHELEKGCPNVEQPLSQNASSLHALGKQFREVGLRIWGQGEKQLADRVAELERLIKDREGK